MNQGLWQHQVWNALGVGIYQGYAVLWFGKKIDSTGEAMINSSATPTPTSALALTPSSDRLLASDGDDTISLSSGELTNYPGGLWALGGNDIVQGSADSELLMGNTGLDSIFGGSGNDTLMGGKESDQLDGGAGNDLVRGDLDADIVRGGDGNDSLFGGRGNDQLFGDAGDDFLSGDRDSDTLTGGAGKDTFVLLADGGLDIITDFENGVDLIQLPAGVSNIRLQSSGANTLIIDAVTGQALAQVNNVSAGSLTSSSFTASGSGGTPTNSPPSGNQDFINRVVELTNAERAKLGLPPLVVNSQLGTAAQTQSQNMALQDFFDHTGRDGSTVATRVTATGYQWSTVGENIGAGYSTPEETVAAWMNSSGHRANILNGNYREIGVGYYFLANDTGSVNYNRYWTQVFGSPLNS